jgi:hypothetical protein
MEFIYIKIKNGKCKFVKNFIIDPIISWPKNRKLRILLKKQKQQKNSNKTLSRRVYFKCSQTEWSCDAKILLGLCQDYGNVKREKYANYTKNLQMKQNTQKISKL